MGEGWDGGKYPSMATRRRAANRPTPTQARRARRQRRERRRRIYRWAGICAVALVAGGLILSLVIGGLPLDQMFGAFSSADGPGQRIEDQGRDHIAVGESHPAYNSVPGTSGWHYNVPIAPKRHGIYETEIEDEYLIHNLEHAYVNVHYDCPEPEGCPELVAQLTPLVEEWIDRGGKLLMSPYSGMGNRIALTAWNYIDKFDEFDEQRIRDFVTTHEGSRNAPEWNALR